MPLHIKVGGGNARRARIHVRVAGSPRIVKQGWVKVGGVWRRFHTNGYSEHSIVAANYNNSFTGFVVYTGVSNGTPQIGSISPNTVADGKSIVDLGSSGSAGKTRLALSGSGLTQGLLESLSVNGSTFTGASATYVTGTGTATWTWNSSAGLAPGGSYNAVIILTT